MDKIFYEVEKCGINFLDIGSSGSLGNRWKTLFPLINLIGFDPNVEECERQNKATSPLRSKLFLPYGIYSESCQRTLYRTKSMYCNSLLRPNLDWLKRFTFSDLFLIEGEESVNVMALGDILELKNYFPDIIKIDVQGCELPILSNSGGILDHSFYVETETGFTENYIGETTFSQIDQFMRDKHFLMFDINVNHRVARNNLFKERKTGGEQILWAEAVWLRDYVELERQGKFDALNFNSLKAKRVLLLCAFQKCFDFGYELALLFQRKGLISDMDLRGLENYESWVI